VGFLEQDLRDGKAQAAACACYDVNFGHLLAVCI
jgi:hypothetical protein